MTNIQKETIKELRSENYSYDSIARKLGLNMNTVKSYCLRHSVPTPAMPRKNKAQKAALRLCEYCGKRIDIHEKNPKRFCSDKCRTAFWNDQRAAARRAGKGGFPLEKHQKTLDFQPLQS